MNIKKFKDFKSINENSVADAIHQAIENHMNGDMESLETIAGLTGLDTESIVSVLNQYNSDNYEGAFDGIMNLINPVNEASQLIKKQKNLTYKNMT